MSLPCPTQEGWLHDGTRRRDEIRQKESMSPERAPCLGDGRVLQGTCGIQLAVTGASGGNAGLSLRAVCSSCCFPAGQAGLVAVPLASLPRCMRNSRASTEAPRNSAAGSGLELPCCLPRVLFANTRRESLHSSAATPPLPWGRHLAPLVIPADLFNIVQLRAGRERGSLPAEPQLGVGVGELRLAVRHTHRQYLIPCKTGCYKVSLSKRRRRRKKKKKKKS